MRLSEVSCQPGTPGVDACTRCSPSAEKSDKVPGLPPKVCANMSKRNLIQPYGVRAAIALLNR